MEATKDVVIKISVDHKFVTEAVIAKVVMEKGFALTPENTDVHFTMSGTCLSQLATTTLTSSVTEIL